MRLHLYIFLVWRRSEIKYAFDRLSAVFLVFKFNNETRGGFGSFGLLRFAGFSVTSLRRMSNFRSCRLLRNTKCTGLADFLVSRFDSITILRLLLKPL